MNDRHAIWAFSMLVFAILYLATIAAWLAYNEKYAEALGFGGLTTGLVGVLGSFRPKTSGLVPAGTPGDPVSTTSTEETH